MAIAHLPQLNLSHPIESLILPSQLQVAEDWGPTSHVKDSEGTRIGIIRKRAWDFTWKNFGVPIHDLLDEQEHVLATGIVKFAAYSHVIIEFRDSEGDKIGSVKQKPGWFSTIAKVRTGRGKKIAEIVSDFWGGTLTVRDPKNIEKVYATMRKRVSGLFAYATWELNIQDAKIFRKYAFDPRLLLMLPGIEIDLANVAKRDDSD